MILRRVGKAFIDLMTGRAKEVPQEIAESFELVSPDDERLQALGIDRPMRFDPTCI